MRDTFRDGLKRGKEFQEFLDEKRSSKIMFRDTLRGDAIEWWDNL